MKEKFLNSSMNLIIQNQQHKYTNDDIEMIKYGLEAIYLTLTKMIIIFALAYFLEIIKEVLLLLLTYNIIRSQAFGLHASKSIYCLLSSIIFFIGGVYICEYIFLPNWLTITLALLCNILLFLYAPADTHKRPLINEKKRKQFKKNSTILGIIYTIVIIIFINYSITNYLLLGMLEAVLMILPISYKIFNLPYNNYKNYGV